MCGVVDSSTAPCANNLERTGPIVLFIYYCWFLFALLFIITTVNCDDVIIMASSKGVSFFIVVLTVRSVKLLA